MDQTERVNTIVHGMVEVFKKEKRGGGHLTFAGAADLLTIMDNCPLPLRKQVMDKFDEKIAELNA